MRIAAVDIGTNTVLLLIAEVDKDGRIHALHHEQRLPRLGAHVDRERRIGASMFDLIAGIIAEYSDLARQFGCEMVLAAATSALRDAKNREEFIAHIRRKTGQQIEVLSGDEEALWSFRGALSGAPSGEDRAAVVDIGGGSTEIGWMNHVGQEHAFERHSFDMGAVRLTERFLPHDPPRESELNEAAGYVRNQLAGMLPDRLAGKSLIGVAGTVTTLACLDQHLKDFDLSRVSGYVLERSSVETWLRKLSGMGSDSIRSLSEATEGRADILTAGVLILDEVMQKLGFERLVVSERGLRYGLIVRELEREVR